VTVPSATTDCTGTVSLTISDNFTYSRPALSAPVVPFNANLDLLATAAQFTDLDGVCYDTGAGCQGFARNGIGGASLRLGQTVANNAYGPETATVAEPLLLPVELLYYDNTGNWVTNTADNCTLFSYLITPDGSITVTGNPASPVNVSSGLGDLQLWPTADPAPAGGQVLIDYTLPAWLGPNVQVEAFFGIYRGNDRIINWQEVVR
jgi:MSHA biogenesis protein MshQ